MAVKKRPSKPAPSRPRRSAARRTAAPSVQAPVPPAPTPPPDAEPGRSVSYGPMILALAVVLSLAWWALKRKGPDMGTAQTPALASAPTAVPTSAPAPATPVAAAQPAEPAQATAPSHKHQHSDETVVSFENGKTWSVRCWRTADAQASLDIFGRRNKHVRSVLSAAGPQGWQELSWDGRDDQGNLVPKGEYYALPSQKNEQMVLDLRVKN
jgi:FlgD Ig-like domain